MMDRRISIRGGELRSINGKVASQAQDSIELIIVNAAPISRSYFDNTYDPNVVKAPVCWSPDTQLPATDVPQEQKQSARCMDCSQNVRGSGSNGGRACRFAQRLAVVLAEDPSVVYRLQLPATSIYGRGSNGDMPLQEYVKFLSARGSDATGVVTQVYMDRDSVVPKLYFKAVRPLRESELDQVDRVSVGEDATTAIRQDPYKLPETTSPFGVVDGFEIDAN
tara:strand:- start:511 stop:1176 length:666 start_codon:yes stop_codon:yes gene_type:complete